MKKRFLSIILAVLVVMSAISLPTFAYSNICEDINFDRFDRTDWTTAGAKYGTVSPWGAQSSGARMYYAGALDRDNNGGKSMHVKINANTWTGTDTPNSGFKYIPDDVLTGKVHISASSYIASHTETGYMYRYITAIKSDGTQVDLVTFTDGVNYTYFWNGTASTGASKQVPWTPGAWMDVDIWYDLDNNAVTYKVSTNGTVVYNQSFNAGGEVFKQGIKEIGFRSLSPKWLYSKSTSGNYAKEENIYWDNITVETIDFMPGNEKDYIADYEGFTASSVQWHFPTVPADAEYTNKQNVGGGTIDGFMSAQAGKGNSLKLVTGTGTTTNANLQFIPTQSPAPSAVSGKMSMQVPDKSFHKIAYLKTSGGDQINTVLFSNGGNLLMFGRDIGTYKFNHWYDIEYSYCASDGSYFYRVNDGETEYIGNGNYTQSKGYPQTVSQMVIQLNNQKTKINSHIIVDDLVFKAVDDEFKMDKDLSANGKTIGKNETVYARFTKELNETPATLADKVFEYYGNAQITSVSLLDKYTVKAEFEKEMGKNYRIDFKNIAASDGSTTSDYIEFDVKKEDLYLTDSIFKNESGEIPALLKAGKITSSIDACANNGKSFKFIYALALYGDSELKSIDSDIINIGSQEQTYTRTLTVPSDGSYVLKAFVWDAVSLEPIRKPQTLKATPDNKPVAIVKLDDLRADNDTYITPFTDIASWSGENGIRISAGIIGESLETSNATEERIAKIKALANNKNVELWFHGYANANTFASDDNEQAQREDFQKGIAAAAKHGITFKTFNPPSNNMRPITAQLIENEFTNFTTVMALSTSGQAYSSYLDRCNDLFTHIKVEPSATGNTDTVDNLKALWNSMSSKKYVLLQAHPAGWTNYEGSEERFKEFLLWLKSEGVVFMTPSEYTAYINTLN